MLKAISPILDVIVIHLLLLSLYVFLYYNIYRFYDPVAAIGADFAIGI